MTKKSIITLVILAVAFIAILLVATFFDLDINIALANSESVFGQFFALFGEATAWLILPLAGVILFQAVTKENRFRVYLKILWLILTVVGWYLVVSYFFSQIVINIKAKMLYEIVFALIFSVFSILGTNKVDKKIMQKLAVFAVFALVALAIGQAVTTFLKSLWGRQRFRNMPDGDYSGFDPWYSPNWFKKGSGGAFVSDYAGHSDEGAFKSFPSGHTMASALSFIVIMLPDLFDRLKKYKLWFYVVPAIYTVAVAISRIIIRAHFLSDVLVGGTIGILSVFLSRYLVILIKNKITAKYYGDKVLQITGQKAELVDINELQDKDDTQED
ncbi:MAG: phosphatase PAP2 family protein [Clostridiales bacterium]|nr:phosphatase PAP2 family protein [Clostridiales bacterium]